MGIFEYFKSIWQKISSSKKTSPSQPSSSQPSQSQKSVSYTSKPTTTASTPSINRALASIPSYASPTVKQGGGSGGGYYISEKGEGYTIKDVSHLKHHQKVSLASGKAIFIPIKTEQKQTTATTIATTTAKEVSQAVSLTPSLQKSIEEYSQMERLKPKFVVIEKYTHIPESERIVKEPSPFQKIVGFVFSPFATYAQIKYSSPVIPTQYEIHRAFTLSGRGTSQIIPDVFTPEFTQFGGSYPIEIKERYPQAYAWAEIKRSATEITARRQKEYESAVYNALSQYQTRTQMEYEKTAQSIFEKEIKPTLFPKYQALAQTGKYSEAEIQEMYVKEVESLLSQHPKLKEIEQNYKNVSESIAAAYASKYQTLTYTDIERKTNEILRSFQREMKSEIIKGKVLDIPWQVGISLGLGAGIGAGATAFSKLIPAGIVRTGGMTLLTKSELATMGGLTFGTGIAALSIKNLAEEYSTTKQLDKSLARKELAVNIASLIGTGAGFAMGYGAGAREMGKRIASTEITKEYSINIMKEVGKGGVIGKGYTIQKVSYEVPLLFTKKSLQELRIIEYPFVGAVKPEGIGRQALAFLEKSKGKALGVDITGTKAKGYFVFGKAILRQYEPFKGGWALTRETIIKPQEPFGKVLSVSKGKLSFFTEVGGEKRILRYPSKKEIYFTTSEFEKGIRGGGISKELERLNIRFKVGESYIKIKTPIRTFLQTEIRERTISKKLSFLIPKVKPETEKIFFVSSGSKSFKSISKPFKPITQLAKQTQLQKLIPTPKFEIPTGKQRLIFTPKLASPISINKEITKTITTPVFRSAKVYKQLQYQIPSFKFIQKQTEKQSLIFLQAG
ncbi:MAG: hypothetical protein QXS37_03885, partial [Candidatus Aenigmatarchaeota archaeon]